MKDLPEEKPETAIADGDDTPLLVGDYDVELVRPWIDYLYGEWTREAPNVPGVYDVATLDGDFVGQREFVQKDGKVFDPRRAVNEPGWQGWYWSIARPAPPKAVP